MSGIAVAILTLSCSTSAFAAVCNPAPDGVHHFSAHRRLGVGYTVDIGYHSYLFGYTEGKEPIYHDDCKRTAVYEYCDTYCVYCGMKEPDNRHHELVKISHSILH